MKRAVFGALVLAAACGKQTVATQQPEGRVDVGGVDAPVPMDRADAGVATERATPLRWVGSDGGGVGWLPTDDAAGHLYAAGSFMAVSDAAGVRRVLESKRRVARSTRSTSPRRSRPAPSRRIKRAIRRRAWPAHVDHSTTATTGAWSDGIEPEGLPFFR